MASKQALIEREQQLAKQADAQYQQQLAAQQALTEREEQLKEQERTNRETSEHRAGIEAARRHLSQYQYDEAIPELGRVPSTRRGWELDRLGFQISLARMPAHYVGHHDWGIVDLIKSNDDATIVSSGLDGRVIAWRTHGGGKQELERGLKSEAWLCWRPFFGPLREEPPETPTPDCFGKLCWLRDGESVMGASIRGKLVAWDLNGVRREEIHRHDHPLTSITASPDGELLILADDKGQLIHSRDHGREWRKFTVGESAVMDLVMLSSDRCLIGEASGRIALIDLVNDQVVAEQNGPAPVWDLDYSAHSDLVAVGGATQGVATIRVHGNSLVAGNTYTAPPSDSAKPQAVHAVRFSSDGAQIMAGDEAGRLFVWEVGNSTQVRVFNDQVSAQLDLKSLSVFPPFIRRRFAAVAFSSDNAAAFTAGLDTSIKRRSLAVPEGVTVLHVGEKPKAVFDPAAPALLWVGTADGKLTLWESWDCENCCSVTAHEGPVTGIAIRSLPKDGEFAAVTCGVDRHIRFWRRNGREIEPDGRFIQSDEPLRSIAISPDGRRVAAYDATDYVNLWEAETGELIGRVSMRHPDDLDSRTVGGSVAFNADGTVLAAAGPSQTLWLFSGESLEIKEQHSGDVVSGSGATAITWHPCDLRTLWVGDTMGRLYRHPDPKFTWGYTTLQSSVIGFSVSPDTRRVAWASSDGVVQIIDPAWVGITHTMQSPYADQQKLTATAMSFDPTGRRLLLAHQSGEIVVWETGPRPVIIPTRAPRSWESKKLLDGERGRGLLLRAESVCLDEDDRLCTLYSRVRREKARDAEFERRIIVLGRETDAGFIEDIIEDDAGSEEAERRGGSPLERSMTLLCTDRELLAAYRYAPELTTAGQIVLIRRPSRLKRAEGDRRLNEPLAETLFGAPDNWGFDLHLFATKDHNPSALHYSHETFHLMATHWVEGKWSTFRVGHHGDGFRHSAVQHSEGRCHIVTGASRFPRNPSP